MQHMSDQQSKSVVGLLEAQHKMGREAQ